MSECIEHTPGVKMDTRSPNLGLRSASTRKDFLLHATQGDKESESAAQLPAADVAQTVVGVPAFKVGRRVQQATDDILTAASVRTTRTIFSAVNRTQRTHKDEVVIGAGADVIAGALPYMDGAAEEAVAVEKRAMEEAPPAAVEENRGGKPGENLTGDGSTDPVASEPDEGRVPPPDTTHLTVGDGGVFIDDEGLFEVCLDDDDDDHFDTPVDGPLPGTAGGGVFHSDHRHVDLRQRLRQAYTSPKNRLLKLVSPKRASQLRREVSVLSDKSILSDKSLIYPEAADTVSISPSLRVLNPSVQLSPSGCISPATITVDTSCYEDSPGLGDGRRRRGSSVEAGEASTSSRSFRRLGWMVGARPQPRRGGRRYTAPVISLHDAPDSSHRAQVHNRAMSAGAKILITHSNQVLDLEASQRGRQAQQVGGRLGELKTLSRPATAAVRATVRHVASAARNTRDRLHSHFMSAVVCRVFGEPPSALRLLRRYLYRYTRKGACEV